MDMVWKRIIWLEKNTLLDIENEGYKLSGSTPIKRGGA
jgi:hypothetical protein